MKKYPLYSLVFSLVIIVLALISFFKAGLVTWVDGGTTLSNIFQANNFRAIISLLVGINAFIGLVYFVYLLAKKEKDNRWLSILQIIFLISFIFIGKVPMNCLGNSAPLETEFPPTIALTDMCERATPTSAINTYMGNPLLYIVAGIIAIIMFFVSLYFVLRKEDTIA